MTIAKPEKMAPATKYGGKIVVCQPGMTRRREVERDDAVHREHERRRERGEDQVRALVVLPVAVRAAPAEGEERRRCAGATWSSTRSRSVARSGMRPMYQKSSDTVKYVLTAKTSQMSGLLKFGQMRHLVREREHVVREPSAADVDAREDERADDGEDRHRLGEAVDRRAPLLAEEEEDGADQRAGVADTDPPDEVRDVPGPVDRARCCPRRRRPVQNR